MLLAIALVGVVVVLGMGMVGVVRGGDPRRSNALMRARVLLQGVALALMAAILLLQAFLTAALAWLPDQGSASHAAGLRPASCTGARPATCWAGALQSCSLRSDDRLHPVGLLRNRAGRCGQPHGVRGR